MLLLASSYFPYAIPISFINDLMLFLYRKSKFKKSDAFKQDFLQMVYLFVTNGKEMGWKS